MITRVSFYGLQSNCASTPQTQWLWCYPSCFCMRRKSAQLGAGVVETAILCEVLATLELFSVSGPQTHGSIENPTVGSSSYLETGGFSSFPLC